VDVLPLDVSITSAGGLFEVVPGASQPLTANVNPTAINGKPVNQVTWSIPKKNEAPFATVTSTGDNTANFVPNNVTQQEFVTVQAQSTVDSSRTGPITLSIPLVDVTIAPGNGFASGQGGGLPILVVVPNSSAQLIGTVTGVTDPRNNKIPVWQFVGPGIGSIGQDPENPTNGILTIQFGIDFPSQMDVVGCAAFSINAGACGKLTVVLIPDPTLNPNAVSLNPGAQQQFTSIANVTWSVVPPNLGTITQTGLYTAPPPPNDFQQTATVKACFNSAPNPCGTATVTLLPSPDFSVTPVAPATIAVTPGGAASYTVNIAPLNGFTGQVNLSVSSTGIAPTISPTQVTLGNSPVPVTVTVPNTAVPLLNYTIVVSGQSPALGFTHTANLGLNVVDFNISATPNTLTASGGGDPTYTVTTGALNNFNFPVCLVVTGQPSDVTPNFKPACISGAGTSTMSLPISNTTQVGNYSLAIVGTSTAGGGTDSHQVTPNPNLTVEPTVSSLSQSLGPILTTITITGTNFGSAQNGSTLAFGTVPATNITTWSSTSIVAQVPAGVPAGPNPVVVTVNNIASNNNVSFTVVPTITGLSVTVGPIGTPLTITGTSFGSSQGNSTVTFNGVASTNTVSWADGSVTVLVPAALTPGVYSVVVTVNATASNPPGVTAPTFTVVPSITSIVPGSGASGTSVIITGTNFGPSQGSSTVTFNGTTGTPSNWSNNSITVPVPTGLQPGPGLVVVTNSLPSNAAPFTVLPGITGINPGFGPVGSSVSITGTSLGTTQGNGTVTFNGIAAAVTTWSNATLTVTVPAGATTGNVVVTAGGVASPGTQFVVTAPTTYFLTSTASVVSGLMTLSTTNGGTTSLNSADLNNQPTGEYLIQAFDTAVGVPGAASTWPAGLAATFTVWMKQTTGTTGNLFPDLKLYLNSLSGTPICSVIGTTALTTTNTQYNLNCAPATNIARAATDQYYLWVGVNSTQAATSSTQATVGLGIQLRGRPASSVTVPIN
jgi:hypothetical protein